MIDQMSYGLFCRGRLPDPYPVYHWLRDYDPVHWSDGFNGWVLTRYRDVLAALRDVRLRSFGRIESYMRGLPQEEWEAAQPLYRHYMTWMVNLDPPDHTRLRTLINKAFTPRVVESLREYIESTCCELIDAAIARGHMDVMSQLACPLPALVIARMLGVPAEEREQFQNWSREISAFTGTGQPEVEKLRSAQRSMRAMTEYVTQLAAQRRQSPQADLLSELVKVEEQGNRLNEHELAGMCVFLLVAGHETTTGLIGNGMAALFQYPDQLEKLCREPGLIASAVEEFLRYESPLQHQVRVAGEDFVMEGRTIRQGQRIVLFLGAANRDEEQFPQPDQLDIARENNRHLAFGYGPHFCVGAPLARLEGKIAFDLLLKALPGMRLKNASIAWRQDTSMRQPLSLDIQL